MDVLTREHPDADAGEEQREGVGQSAGPDPLLQLVPASAPTAAGSPTSAAYPTSTSPRKPKTITPARAVIPIAPSDVAVAARSGRATSEDEQRDGDDPASDPEEGGEDPRHESDGDEAHGRIVRAWSVGSASSRRCWSSSGSDRLGHGGATTVGRIARSYVVRARPSPLPVSPLCGGYWVALANAARTRCADGLAGPRCYVPRAAMAGEPRDPGRRGGTVVAGCAGDVEGRSRPRRCSSQPVCGTGLWAPRIAARLLSRLDNGVRCVRAPCFSIRAIAAQRHRRRLPVSGVDLEPRRALTRSEVARGAAGSHSRRRALRAGRIVPSPTAVASSAPRGSTSEQPQPRG